MVAEKYKVGLMKDKRSVLKKNHILASAPVIKIQLGVSRVVG